MSKRILLFSRNTSTLHYSFYCDVGWSATVKRDNSEPDNLTSTKMNYICFYCQKSFRSKSNLCRHLRERICCRPVEERKRFQCTFCETTFTTDDNRRRYEQFWCRRKHTLLQQIKQEPTEEPWLSRVQPERLEDRIEKTTDSSTQS